MYTFFLFFSLSLSNSSLYFLPLPLPLTCYLFSISLSLSILYVLSLSLFLFYIVLSIFSLNLFRSCLSAIVAGKQKSWVTLLTQECSRKARETAPPCLHWLRKKCRKVSEEGWKSKVNFCRDSIGLKVGEKTKHFSRFFSARDFAMIITLSISLKRQQDAFYMKANHFWGREEP